MNTTHILRKLLNGPSKPLSAVLILFAIALFLLSSCNTNPKDELNKKINIAIRNDNKVDEKEWNGVTSYILENKVEFPDIVDNEKSVNSLKLTNAILEIAHHRRAGQTDPEIFNPKSIEQNSIKPQVKVFIENSGSMDGYIRGTTEFEAALSDLLVQIQYHFDNKNLKVNFINTKIYPSEITEVKDFVEALEPEKAPYKVGDRTVSKLNEILKMILDSTTQENISILISDCIYSLDPKYDTEGALEFEKSLTKGAFLEKSKQFPFATIVLKMKSKFTGKYWKKDNSFEQLNGVERPYYIWIIGSNNNINEFSKKIKTKSLKGFEYSYYLSDFAKEKQPFYTILKETNTIGSFKQAKEERGNPTVHTIEDVSYDKRKFQFSLAIDLSQIPVDSSYLTTASNYKADGFEIVSVERIDQNKLKPNEWKRIEKTSATHIATVSISTASSLRNLKLELSNKIPAWVDATNSLDDRNIKNELDKTFGLAYLVQGVSEAYATQNPEQSSYFNLMVTIKK